MSEKLNLYQKISHVMQDVSYLSKDDNIAFGNTKYKAISEEKVTRTLRESLIKNGLVILPFEQESSKTGNISFVNTKYKIVDIESGQFEVLASSGEGADTQDKGVGKAMTYAYKYMLLRTFAIPTGEDPDKVSSPELDEKQRKEQEKLVKEIKTKYQAGNGSLDGFEQWEQSQLAKGHDHRWMLEVLTQGLLKKAQEQKGGKNVA